jgi:cell fate regulator YaaT (PSP1 superfamily)
MVEPVPSFDEFSDSACEAPLHGGCSSCGAGKSLDDEAATAEAEKSLSTTAVRFGYMRYIGEFSHPADVKFTSGARVVIQTQRGIEIGEHVALMCSGCERSVKREQVVEWVQQSGEDTYLFDAGRILREATAADLAEYTRMQATCRQKRALAQQAAERHGLPLKVVECESPFGGERIVFYFTAAERIDFRTMVKDLAKEFRTRIEMRQIGARDEARLLADFETCGREVCCKVFLKPRKPITMRMAKLQKATLDPSQVSGRCGRLKCCLRYEHLSYEELDKQLPRTGVRVRTEHGEGVITNRQVLTQLVQIRKDDDTLITVAAEDITAVNLPPPASAEPAGPAGRRVGEPVKETANRAAGADRASRVEPRVKRLAEPDEQTDSASDGAIGDGQSEGEGERPGHRRRRRRRRKRRPADAAEGNAAGEAAPPQG